MSQSDHPETRNFFCDHCGGEIRVPFDLPPTTAPCPFCQRDITSPAPPLPGRPVDRPGSVVPPPKTTPLPAAEVSPPPAATVEVPTEEAAPKPEVLKTAPEVRPRVGDTTGAGAPTTQPETAGATTGPVTTKAEDLPPPAPRRSILPSILFLLAVLVLVGLVVWGIRFLQEATAGGKGPGAERVMDENQFIRDGWKNAATERLRAFLAAQSVGEMAQHVLGGEEKLEAMRAFYADRPELESDMPLDAFSHYSLDLEDREAGVFLMRYERPAQFDIREFFRPVAPLEVRYGVAEEDLLLASAGALTNFAMEPVHAMVFFKRVDGELRIDWDTYVQTKHRTLRDFSATPEPGRQGTFRVVIQEDLPGFAGGEGDGRVYRLTDPSQAADYVKVQVREDSELGLALSGLNWIGVEREDVPERTATVELGWTNDADPHLEVARLVCWDFLGLLGVEGNARPAPAEDVEVLEAPEDPEDLSADGDDPAP